ncbi:hypothetical protein ERX27_07400 [Macrococcus brunensis]|uniref:Uncharacterized protein n=1 Tax=Macrococcus brunensis TaxID=198483 RepID=A0A4R6BD08_9STAP|nr:hypothetical protein [Macrococcus brunensis]TDL96672.1 hypothetical protein ERX27_07400 [Macrococcus brunensis]
MTEIIPFPGLPDKLNRQLQTYIQNNEFEPAYETILELERHVELSHQQQLQKLEILYALESFLELREEASILLNQGHPNYEVTVYYFLLSLFELGQYQTVIELIDSLRAEEIDHRLKMKLLPLYDQARHRKNLRDRQAADALSDFVNWSADRQVHFIQQLINEENMAYTGTVLELLKSPLHPVVQTVIIQYIQLAGEREIIQVNKFGTSVTFLSSDVVTIDRDFLIEDVLPLVLDWFESNMPDMAGSVQNWMERQALVFYPINFDIDELTIETDVIADCYIYFALSMFQMEEIYPLTLTEDHEHVLDIIKEAVKYEL